jgi:hypothetical protein
MKKRSIWVAIGAAFAGYWWYRRPAEQAPDHPVGGWHVGPDMAVR